MDCIGSVGVEWLFRILGSVLAGRSLIDSWSYGITGCDMGPVSKLQE